MMNAILHRALASALRHITA